ncbi:MAG: chromate transporter [Treponema sp.]|jgi:chromate transporter|nr:chromate transporter [Treponema sp.]
MTLLKLVWIFFQIGLFTIGGGQVAITLMYQPLVDGRYIDATEFYNMVAVSESTPGPIGINMATYIGCKFFGVWGGVIITFATVLPAFIIILIIAEFFEKYYNTPVVKSIFSCVRPVSAGLIAVAAWNVFQIAVIPHFSVSQHLFGLDIWCIVFFIISTLLLINKKLSPLTAIAAGAVFGLFYF